MFKEVYAMEKIHGTSAHITFKTNPSNPEQRQLVFFSGGESYERFVSLFDKDKLMAAFEAMTVPSDKDVTVYGEAYGGKQQGMSATYGTTLKFIAFDVEIGNCWLDVPNAEAIAKSLGLEFVHYVKVATDLALLDAQRDAPSEQAKRNLGIVDFKHREGIVIRPLKEMTLNNGARVIAKHKGEAFKETATPRPVETDATKLAVLASADAIADEWVTPMRLKHVLDKIPDHDMSKMRTILDAMTEDVLREGAGEIDLTDEKAVKKAITRKTSMLYKEYLTAKLAEVA